jgi:hypothetical protein
MQFFRTGAASIEIPAIHRSIFAIMALFPTIFCLLSACTTTAGDGIFSDDRFKQIELTDADGKRLPAEILSRPLNAKIFVRYKHHDLQSSASTAENLALQQRLAQALRSDLSGAFIYVPWGKGQARLGHYSAINIPGHKDQIFICGGDESPNNVRFAADKTWIYDFGAKKIVRGPDLNYARLSPVLTAMPDGKILISSGTSPALELFNPQTMKISKEGIFAEAAEALAAIPLGNGKILLLCPATVPPAIKNARPSAEPRREQDQDRLDVDVKLGISQPTLRPILYDPVKRDLTSLPLLKDLTELQWAAPVGDNQALLLGSRILAPISQKAAGKPVAELVTTERTNP